MTPLEWSKFSVLVALDDSQDISRAFQFCFIAAGNDLEVLSFYLARFEKLLHSVHHFQQFPILDIVIHPVHVAADDIGVPGAVANNLGHPIKNLDDNAGTGGITPVRVLLAPSLHLLALRLWFICCFWRKF